MPVEVQESSEPVALAVREELARRRLSRQWLADRAKVSLSTLEKALSGRRPFTLATIVRIEDALEIKLRRAPSAAADPARHSAPDEMGAYVRAAVQWLEGEYLTLRPSFSDGGAIYAYFTSIGWDDHKGHLIFSESGRTDRDYEQQGFVSFPHLSGQIYLVTSFAGQYRIATLSRPIGGGALNGVLSTLIAGQGAQLIPAAAPIVLLPTSLHSDPALGVIHPGEACFDDYHRHVGQVLSGGFARFPA